MLIYTFVYFFLKKSKMSLLLDNEIRHDIIEFFPTILNKGFIINFTLPRKMYFITTI